MPPQTENISDIGEIPFTIILSPHFDDGVLSLGGLMAKLKDQALVATFFTQKPTELMHTQWDKISGFSDSDEAIFARTKENEKALLPLGTIIRNYDYPDFQYRKKGEDVKIRGEISKDIETLIKVYKNRKISIYGPATFGPKITHPDHQIVHDALMDVWKNNKKAGIYFFIYEDFPYARQFTMSSQISLNSYLEGKEGMGFEESPIELDKQMFMEKITAIYEYKSQVKAFMSLGDDIGILAQKFFKERCRKLLPESYGCEVVHK